MYEIINSNKIMNFNINSITYNIFLKHPLLYTLFYKNNNQKINSGMALYHGADSSYILFISTFGLPRNNYQFSNLGQYYFYSYHGAGRNAIWNIQRKSESKNNVEITRNEYGVYKKGGLVRFIVFSNNIKYFLNRTTDKDDTSKLSQELANNSAFYKEILKIRDTDGKWAVNYDLAYIVCVYVNKNNENLKTRKFKEQYACKNYNQFSINISLYKY